jgi:Family of unknown function (DUF6011)
MPVIWTGSFVELEQNGSWRWVRCYVCHQPLTDPESQARGHGPICQPDRFLRDSILHRERRRYAIKLLRRARFVVWTSPMGVENVVDPRTGEVIDSLDRWVASRRARAAS